jgi:hypothetical protein
VVHYSMLLPVARGGRATCRARCTVRRAFQPRAKAGAGARVGAATEDVGVQRQRGREGTCFLPVRGEAASCGVAVSLSRVRRDGVLEKATATVACFELRRTRATSSDDGVGKTTKDSGG